MNTEKRGLLLSSDLFLTSRITGAAENLGCRLETAATVDDAATKLSDTNYRCLLIDLTVPGLNLSTLLDATNSSDECVSIAYGPHVQIKQLEAARDAGCDIVLPRSRFNTELEDLLKTHLLGE